MNHGGNQALEDSDGTEGRGGGLTPLPKGNGIQALPRKEATKILSQKRTHGSISSLIVQ